MSRRRWIVVVATSGIFGVLSGRALAKGPESSTITGSNIEEPIQLIEDGNPDLVRELMAETGLWFATGGGSRLSSEPEGKLGPAYTLTWINAGPRVIPLNTGPSSNSFTFKLRTAQ